MAYSKSQLYSSVFGNKRVVGLVVSADAASGAVDSGLSVIDGIIASPKSAATASPTFQFNKNSAATALNGSLFIKSAASGDDFYFLVVGR